MPEVLAGQLREDCIVTDLAAARARWRTASGLRAGVPRPWRWKALRSDGQVIPSSWAAAFMLPSRLASAKARSASARLARNRLGCQPSGWRSCPRPTRLRTRQ
jgi:hypothetical protein